MPKELRNDLQFFIDLDKLLTQIDFEYLKPFSEITESTMKKFLDILHYNQAGKMIYLQTSSYIYSGSVVKTKSKIFIMN